MNSLGRWAVIDIETTGIDPNYDAIIDLGFLQFEGTKLIKSYSSLVRTDIKLSQFIQKLTGIKQKDVEKAPHWSKVEPELLELEGHQLLAHNASFEEMFLDKYFTALGEEREKEFYQDSLYFLPLIFPEKSTLNLESFIIDFNLAEKELHRGLADSIDLLKVLLMSVYLVKLDKEFETFLKELLTEFSAEEMWFKKFLMLDRSELVEIASEIEFDLIEKIEEFQNKKAAEPQKLASGLQQVTPQSSRTYSKSPGLLSMPIFGGAIQLAYWPGVVTGFISEAI